MIVAIIQARLGSTRFPSKIFARLSDKPLIWHVVDRLRYSKKIDKIVLATTDSPIDTDLAKWAENENLAFYRGDENDVLKRFYFAAKKYAATIIVRITADDPFKDPNIIDLVIEKLQTEQLDFAYNNNPPSFPEGLDTEVFTFAALENAYQHSVDAFEKEHVTQFFYRNKSLFKQSNLSNNIDLSYLRWTIDTKIDLEMVKRIYDILYKENEIFLMADILNVLEQNRDISDINKNENRSSMYNKI
jgi:spore coat polysaccharide biosynthesis protein SpsF